MDACVWMRGFRCVFGCVCMGACVFVLPSACVWVRV